MRDVQLIDIAGQKVGLAPGFQPRIDVLEYDQLVISLGSRINFSLVPGMKEHAIPFKYLGDAMRIRYEAVRALEEADIEVDPQEKRNLLTFVVAGGGAFREWNVSPNCTISCCTPCRPIRIWPRRNFAVFCCRVLSESFQKWIRYSQNSPSESWNVAG